VRIAKPQPYTPGSFSKRLEQSNFKKLNREAVQRYRAAAASAGAQFFETTAAASQSRSELIAEQVLLRVQADAKVKSATTRNLGSLVSVQT
jgi:hypothetical protein